MPPGLIATRWPQLYTTVQHEQINTLKRHLFIITVALIFLASCKGNNPKPFDKLLVGEWMLDSISGPFKKWDRDFVYITDKGAFWKFTYWNDKYLIDSCFTISANEVLQDKIRNYKIDSKDSLHMTLADNFGNIFFYRNQNKVWGNNYEDELSDFIVQDSIHKLVNGWWKLMQATYKPIELVNYPDKINDFTIYLNKNGRATVFIDHLLDSTVEYSWKTEPGSLSFGRFDVAGSDSPIYYLDRNQMVITFDNRKIDTLTFERCNPLIEKSEDGSR